MRRLFLPVLAVSALVLAACGDDDPVAPTPNPPTAPTNVQAAATDSTNATVTWTVGSGATSQLVTLATGGAITDSASFQNNTTATASFSGLTPGATYQAIVTAINSDGIAPSSAATFTMPSDTTTPPPSGMNIVVTGVIFQNTTWTANNTYTLDGPVFVGVDCGPDPSAPLATCISATLTIEPGTTIYGQKTPTDQNARSSFLVIARGSKIMADATGASTIPSEEQMIVFTSDQPRGSRARGDWGGLILNGRAPINTGDEAAGEGGTGLFGGTDDLDDSGILRGVRVEFAGDDLTISDQLNGIAFQGTGAGTTAEFVQVHYNVDDGTEPFGGSTTQTYMVMSGIGDDSFDGTDGYRGFMQYLIAQQRADAADNGFELSNDGDNETLTPNSVAIVANATMVGAALGEVDNSTEGKSDIGLLHREGSAWRVYNSILTNFNDSGFCVEGAVAASKADAAIAGNTTPGEYLGFFSSILWQNVNRTDTTDVNFADACGSAYDMTTYFNTAGFNNQVVDPNFADDTYLSIGSAMTPPNFAISAVPAGYVPFDVSTLNNEGGTGIIMPTDGRLLEATTYPGAIAPGTALSAAWYNGWTVWDPTGLDSRPNANGQ